MAFAVSTGFNAGVVDGRFGLMARSGTATFTSLRVRTDDPVFEGSTTTPVEEPPVAEPPVVSVSGVRVTEGNSGQKTATVTVTLSKAATSEVRVAWSLVAGSALAGSDFAAGSGELVFAAGETSRTISVTILGDTVVEADEALSVVLGTVSGATVGQGTATVTIENDDTAAAPKPTVSIKSVSTTEPDSGSKTVQVPITLSAPSTEPVTVTVKLAPGTAVAGSDYKSWGGTVTVTFPPGTTTMYVPVVVYGDRTREANETVLLSIVSVTGATVGTGSATLTINNDD